MIVGEYCNRVVIISSREASITEAAQLMRQYHVGDLIVTDASNGSNKPIGILTDRDIVIELIAREQDLASVTVGDIMSTELHTARETDDMMQTIQHMRNEGVRRMPVINVEGNLSGILTVDDVIDIIAEQLQGLAELTRKGRRFEQQKRD